MDSLVLKLLLNKLYRLLSIRARSEKEIRDYLRVRGKGLRGKKIEINDKMIEYLIDTLKQQNLINDLEFAKAWVESRSRKKGSRVIKQELFQKGIDREIVEEVTSAQSSAISEYQTAEKLLDKKMRIWKNLPIMDLRKKAFDFLLRRGFEYEIVKSVVEKIGKTNLD